MKIIIIILVVLIPRTVADPPRELKPTETIISTWRHCQKQRTWSVINIKRKNFLCDLPSRQLSGFQQRGEIQQIDYMKNSRIQGLLATKQTAVKMIAIYFFNEWIMTLGNYILWDTCQRMCQNIFFREEFVFYLS